MQLASTKSLCPLAPFRRTRYTRSSSTRDSKCQEKPREGSKCFKIAKSTLCLLNTVSINLQIPYKWDQSQQPVTSREITSKSSPTLTIIPFFSKKRQQTHSYFFAQKTLGERWMNSSTFSWFKEKQVSTVRSYRHNSPKWLKTRIQSNIDITYHSEKRIIQLLWEKWRNTRKLSCKKRAMNLWASSIPNR